ncbi:hypothetical protein B7463_g6652, partial [Scytalidium lignicola]
MENRYVGNTMAAFVMQSLGCEVAALNTVIFNINHLGYGQATGRRSTAEEISELYRGLKESGLDDFDMMLSGYLPGAASVEAMGKMARDLKSQAAVKLGNFFWVLDPVMGDNGRLYVAEDVVPAYKNLIKDADLILPNQFEAETLSGVKITDMNSLKQAIVKLHSEYGIPHIIITSVVLPNNEAELPLLSVIGSTITSTKTARIFKIPVPAIDCFFSGTGDMFAALMLVRLREAVCNTNGLIEKASWVSDDKVEATELPLAKAAEKALASMHEVLRKTKEERDKELAKYLARVGSAADLNDVESQKKLRLAKSKAAEVRLIRNLDCLRHPKVIFKAEYA